MRFLNVRSLSNVGTHDLLCLVRNVSTKSNAHSTRSYKKLSNIVNFVNDHFCGNSTYGYVTTILERNKLCNNDVQDILSTIVEKCLSCIASSPPKAFREVSIAGINRQFNVSIFVDHFSLVAVFLIHFMYAYSRFSVCQPVTSTLISLVTVAFENQCIGQFWPPRSVQVDLSFQCKAFLTF